MDTKTNSRIQKLEFLLKQMDKIHLRDAAEILNVSEMTIRRDLGTEPGSLVLLGGYIVKDPQHLNENSYFILEQQNKNIVQKMQSENWLPSRLKKAMWFFLIVVRPFLLLPPRLVIPCNLPHFAARLILLWCCKKSANAI